MPARYSLSHIGYIHRVYIAYAFDPLYDMNKLEKNVLRKCHENRHVMRYALFAARAQIYRRIDDICNDIKPGFLA